jgi:hypothetical protein
VLESERLAGVCDRLRLRAIKTGSDESIRSAGYQNCDNKTMGFFARGALKIDAGP